MTNRQTHLAFVLLAALAVAAWAAYFYVRAIPEKGLGAPRQPAAVRYAFPPVETEAASAVVYDLSTGQVLYAKNAEAQLPLASVAKLMLPVALAGQERGVTIAASDLAPEGKSSLRVGERWRLTDLLSMTLAMSVNDGAHALAAAAAAGASAADPAANLNALARSLGLTQTYFIDPTGLDVSSTTSGAYGSALDMAKLMAAALRADPAVLEATAVPAFSAVSEDGTEHPVINTNPLVPEIPGLVASKTGFTDLARGNLVMAVDMGFYHPVAVVVLDSSYEGRFRDATMLIEATRTAFEHPLP